MVSTLSGWLASKVSVISLADVTKNERGVQLLSCMHALCSLNVHRLASVQDMHRPALQRT